MTQHQYQTFAPPQARLSLKLLGPAQVALRGQPVVLPYEKLLALLVFLAVEAERAHRREALAELFWPEQKPAAARHNLSQALFHLRRLGGDELEPPLLLTTRETVRLNPAAGFWVDVAAFQTLAAEDGDAAEQREAAVALYGGPFGEGLVVRDSAEFEAWVAQTAERLRRQACALLQCLSHPEAGVSDRTRACSYARRWVELDPLNEAAHRRLMQALTAAGQRTAALVQFEQCRRLLETELGVAPEPETVALYEALKQPEPPASRASGALHRPLPRLQGELIGRGDDMAALGAVLAGIAVRLVSVIGPGGVGKTRLALQLAADNAGLFADGVCYVPLAALRETAQVAAAIAHALWLPPDAPLGIEVQVQRALAPRRLLLVLDNCEQLLPGLASYVATLLDAAPRLCILATSRAPLHLSYERRHRLTPLALPRGDEPAEAQLATAAAALFVERARAVRPGLELDPAVISPICRALDGLPLALELAATRTRLLAPAELLARLGSRLALLSGGPHDLPARQQTLSATIDWSYQLLSPSQQALFRRLAVFAGGWTVSAAETIGADLNGSCVLDDLDGLLNASLIVEMSADTSEPRCTMLETIVEFAREQLVAAGELEQTRRRHALAVAAFAERAREGMEGPEQRLWLERIHQERDNIRVALAWCAEWAPGLGLRLAADLQRYCLLRGHRREVRDWLEQLLAQGARSNGVQPAPDERAYGLLASGTLSVFLHELDLADARIVESAALYELLGDQLQLAAALNARGLIAMQRRNYSEAEQFFRQSLALRRALNHTPGIAASLANLGAIVMMQGNNALAQVYYAESLALYRRVSDPSNIALVLARMANLLLAQGAYAEAEQLFEESHGIAAELLNRQGIWQALHGLGTIAREQGRYAEAHARFRQSSAVALEIQYLSGLALDLLELARITWATQPGEHTAILLAAVTAITHGGQITFHHSDQTERDRLVEEVRATLEPHLFAAAWAYGQALSLEQVVALAGDAP
jgi:predicted ATPase/DNA-binding SARP family transcriptional activator